MSRKRYIAEKVPIPVHEQAPHGRAKRNCQLRFVHDAAAAPILDANHWLAKRCYTLFIKMREENVEWTSLASATQASAVDRNGGFYLITCNHNFDTVRNQEILGIEVGSGFKGETRFKVMETIPVSGVPPVSDADPRDPTNVDDYPNDIKILYASGPPAHPGEPEFGLEDINQGDALDLCGTPGGVAYSDFILFLRDIYGIMPPTEPEPAAWELHCERLYKLAVTFMTACPLQVNQVQRGELVSKSATIIITNHTVAPGFSGAPVGKSEKIAGMHLKSNGGVWHMACTHPAFVGALAQIRDRLAV
eukprot:TRINITY_DN17058_c0_g1_i1.p1 TRINITY_DN17058_c0_g1~~TRINITY_DN17058_c0_g1_i1.p1  ORF type:complete len:305 (+),score=28.19 TRINITY_DN17058_c0_g1_i1:72-986(+)